MIAADFESMGTNRWRMEVPGQFVVSARLHDGWLCSEAPSSAAFDPVALLELNAKLLPPLKFAPDRRGCVCLRAELPLMHDSETEAGLRSLATSYARWSGVERLEKAEAMAAEQIAALCDQAGWPATIRGTDCRVPLVFEDRRSAFLRAEDGIIASVDVVTPGDSAACVAAVALLLFRAGGTIRLARPTFTDGIARFETFIPSQPCMEQIDAALSALSVALECCAREAEALGGDEALAAEYLALSDGGPAAHATITTTTTEP